MRRRTTIATVLLAMTPHSRAAHPRCRSAKTQSNEATMTPANMSTGPHGLIAAATVGILAARLCVASAADPSSASRTVRFADLNISSPSGAHVLYMRIRAAAQVVCSHYWFATDGDRARCVRDATADAVTKINQPALSTVYNATNRTSVPISLPSQSR